MGGAFIQVKKKLAVGVDGISIKGWHFDGGTLRIEMAGTMSQLKMPWNQPYLTDLRVVGLEEGKYKLVFNGAEPLEVTASQLSSLPIRVHPDGSVRAVGHP